MNSTVTLNLTKKEAEYLFWLMTSEERDGVEIAGKILSKLPLPKRRS
ncbi:MAG: hypothetical protein ACTSUO_00750 [Candidatus Thorarchaeota archaeon]